ncbi:MAG: translation initiation factor [Planctomycetia bacterium]
MASNDGKLVWSSRGLAPAPKAGAGAAPPTTGRVRVRLERQGRGGKVVSVVENLPGHPERIEQVARALKARCGAGGTVKGRLVEIQGDHRDRIVAALAELGLEAVRAGG